MKLFPKIALATATISIASVASAASSISGSTNFRVTLPEILVLYHWDDAHLTLTDIARDEANNSDPNREISDDRAHTASGSLSAAANQYLITENPVDTNTTATERVAGNVVKVKLVDSWAVRSLSTAPVHLTLAIQQPELINKGTATDAAASKITVKNAELTGAGIAASKTVRDIASGWQAVTGNIEFDLDLSLANHSGQYSSHANAGVPGDSPADNANDTFLLTLTGN